MIGICSLALSALCILTLGESIAHRRDLDLDNRGSLSVNKRQARNPPTTWGPNVTLGETSSEYVSVQMTYVPGHPPAQITGDIFLWGGLLDQSNRASGDFVKTVVEGHPLVPLQRACYGALGQWCIRPVVVHGCCISQAPPEGIAINGRDQILIDITKARGPGGMWTQTLWNLNQGKRQLFNYSKGNAPAKWFQIATELQAGSTGTADVQNYYNISLRLKVPDPDLGAKFKTTGKAESDPPSTTDGGKTWTIKHVMIPAMVQGKAFVPPPSIFGF